jgi:hypothetical protein
VTWAPAVEQEPLPEPQQGWPPLNQTGVALLDILFFLIWLTEARCKCTPLYGVRKKIGTYTVRLKKCQITPVHAWREPRKHFHAPAPRRPAHASSTAPSVRLDGPCLCSYCATAEHPQTASGLELRLGISKQAACASTESASQRPASVRLELRLRVGNHCLVLHLCSLELRLRVNKLCL